MPDDPLTKSLHADTPQFQMDVLDFESQPQAPEVQQGGEPGVIQFFCPTTEPELPEVEDGLHAHTSVGAPNASCRPRIGTS